MDLSRCSVGLILRGCVQIQFGSPRNNLRRLPYSLVLKFNTKSLEEVTRAIPVGIIAVFTAAVLALVIIKFIINNIIWHGAETEVTSMTKEHVVEMGCSKPSYSRVGNMKPIVVGTLETLWTGGVNAIVAIGLGSTIG